MNDILWKLLNMLGVQKDESVWVGKPRPGYEPMLQPGAPGVQNQRMATPTPEPTATQGYVKTEKSPTQNYSQSSRNPQGSKFQIGRSVREALESASSQYGVPQDLLYDIALSESGFNPQAQSNESTAGGLFQFTNPTWQDAQRWQVVPEGADKYDPVLNALAAAFMISKGYLGKWDASKSKWGQFYKDDELKSFYR